METQVMDTTVAVEQLTDRVVRLEQTVDQLCRALAEHEREAPANDVPAALPIRFADKQKLRQAMRQLMAALEIEGEPIGAENLQRMMEHSGLEKDELSRSLIEARDE